MTEQQWLEKLKKEGYRDLRVCPVNTDGKVSEPHTHDIQTVHVILEGELTLIENRNSRVLKIGERFDIPKGTTHQVKSNPEGVKMIAGEKY